MSGEWYQPGGFDKKKERKGPFLVRAAESPHGGRDIPGASVDGKRLADKVLAAKEQFPTGSQRDTQTDKPRYDLIPVEPLRRLAAHYALGGKKYGDNNWRLGQPNSRVYASLLRHVYAWAEGDESEDHLAAVAWNAFALMYNEGREDLDDMDETVRS